MITKQKGSWHVCIILSKPILAMLVENYWKKVKRINHSSIDVSDVDERMQLSEYWI